MKALRNLVILGILGALVWSLFLQQGPGDRPSILVSNGPVRIEEASDGKRRGEFQKGLLGMGRSWYHHHPAHGPSHFEVVVTDSSCGPEARYDDTELTVLSGGPGTSSTFTISIWGIGPLAYLEVDPDTGTTLNHDAAAAPQQILVGTREEQLQTVRIGAATCAFVAGQGSITINQRH
jgi:hypothetical protein